MNKERNLAVLPEEDDDAIRIRSRRKTGTSRTASGAVRRSLEQEAAAARTRAAGAAGKPDARPAVPARKGQAERPAERTAVVPYGGSQTACKGVAARPAAKQAAIGSRARASDAEKPAVRDSAGRRAGHIVGRCLIGMLTAVLLAVYSVYAVVYAVANGPSVTLRNQLVMMALQASATKWAPGLFLSAETVEQILSASKVINKEQIDIGDVTPGGTDTPGTEKDEWASAVDGVLYSTLNYSGFKAYVTVIRDPSRVFVGVSSDDFQSATSGMRIWTAADKYNALIAINAGEFRDTSSDRTGARPIGLTYSRGQCVWNDGYTTHTFIGIDRNDCLVVQEGMTKSQADAMGIRDAVMFQEGNVLLTNDGQTVTAYRRDDDTGTAQRTAVGQRSDGSFILLVTDGRTASSIGATKNDVIDVMLSLGAVTAGMLDGGSSAMMYYRDYYNVYQVDQSTLDQYQLQGLVNKYKAFTTPRTLPTFFMVAGGSGS